MRFSSISLLSVSLPTVVFSAGAGIGSIRTDFAIDVSLGLRELMFELRFLE
jgi:hypothetical protein